MGLSGSNPRKIHPFRRFLGDVAMPSMALAIAVIVLRQLGGLEAIEMGLYDRFIRWRPDEGIDDRFLVVGVDETDIQTLNQYPLQDGTVANLLAKLETYNPRVIALDIARDVPQGDEDGRQRLEQVVAEGDRIITGCQLSGLAFPGIAPTPGTPDDRVGFADFPQDRTGVVRRAILVSVPVPPPDNWPNLHLCNNPDAQPVSLALASALMYLKAEGIEAEKTEFEEIQLGQAILLPVFPGQYGGYHNTGAVDYQLMLNYRSALNAVRQVTLTDVMNGAVDPTWIKDRIVMIGYTSLIAGDFLPTPYLSGQNGVRGMPGVVVHAQSASQIISAVLDQRPLIWALPPLLEWIWILLWGVLGGILVTYVRQTGLFLLCGIIALSVCGGISYQLFLWGAWIPVAPGAIAILVAMVGVGLLQQAKQGGYAQAIYEQLRDQIKAQVQRDSEHRPSHSMDILEDLVQRARTIRQQRAGLTDEDRSKAESEAGDWIDIGIDSTTPQQSVNPSTLQTQALYDEIRAKVEAELASKKQATAATQAAKREKKLQDLLDRARKARQGGA